MMRSWMDLSGSIFSFPLGSFSSCSSSSFETFLPVSSSMDDDWIILSHIAAGGASGRLSKKGRSKKVQEGSSSPSTVSSTLMNPGLLSSTTTLSSFWTPRISTDSLASWSDSFSRKAVDDFCEVVLPRARDLLWLGIGAFAIHFSPFKPNFWQHWRLSRLPHSSAGHCYKELPLPLYKRMVWWMLPQLGHMLWGKTNSTSVLRIDRVLNRKGFSLGYCFAHRCSLWSSFILTPSACRLAAAPESACTSRFVADRLIPPRYRVDPKLFRSNLGFDRGHLAPKASVGFSTQAADDSFYFSNVILQDATLNRGVWRDLEFLTRYWATSKDTSLAVCVGPVFESDTQGARFVHYNATGTPEVTKKRVSNHQTNNKVFNHLLEKLDAAAAHNNNHGGLHASPARLAPFLSGGASTSPGGGNIAADGLHETASDDAMKKLSKAETAVRVPDFLFMAVQDLASGQGVGFLLPNTTTREQNLLKGGSDQSVGVKSKTAAGAKYQKYLKKQMLSIDQLERSVRTLNGSQSFSLFRQLEKNYRVKSSSELRKKVDPSFWTFD